MTGSEGYGIRAHLCSAYLHKPPVSHFFFHIICTKQKLEWCDKMFWRDSSLSETRFHKPEVPLHTRFTEVKNDGSVNTVWGGTFQVKLVNPSAFSVAGNIWAHIKSVRSDSCATSSALSHWYKSSQLLWHFAWVNQVAGLSGIVLCQQQSWASWDPHSPDSIQRQAGALTPAE